MYIDKGYIYSDAGKILVSGNFIGYSVKADSSLADTVIEENVILDDIVLDGDFIRYCNGKIIQSYTKNMSYAEWKTKIIKWRYSNDDQIAILINKDDSEEDIIKYNRMQEWREYAAKLARKIINLK